MTNHLFELAGNRKDRNRNSQIKEKCGIRENPLFQQQS